MTTTAIRVALFLTAGAVVLGSLDVGGRGKHAAAAFLHAQAAVAATVTTAANAVLDETAPSVTPTSTPRTGPPQPLVRTVEIGAYNDASVVSGGRWSSDQNLGGWTRLGAGPHEGGYYRSYLRFLVAGLPPGMQIDSALLVLTPMDGGGRAVPVEADFVQDDWNEATITWNEQPLSTFKAGTATWQPGSSTPVSIDVTEAAQQWYACGGTSNNGLLLAADLSSDWVGFGSRKSDSPPVLQVTYQTATVPVNCSAPPTSNVSLTPPSGISSSTTGAQVGAVNPNDINNPALIASGTPYGAVHLPVPPSPTGGAPATYPTAPAGSTGGGGGFAGFNATPVPSSGNTGP